MNVTQQRMAIIFNEWANRYAANPSEFSEILDENGNVVKDYGESCAIYFEKLAKELDGKDLLPRPPSV